MNKIKEYVNYILYLGIDKELSVKEKIRAKLINSIAFFSTLSTLFFVVIIIFIIKDVKLLVFPLSWISCTSTMLYFSYRKRFDVVMHFSFIIGVVCICVFYLLLGNSVEFISVFLLATQIVILLFEAKIAKAYIGITLLLFFIIHTINNIVTIPWILTDTTPISYLNNAIALVIFIFMGTYLRNESVRQSENLEKQNILLKEKKEQLESFKYIISHDLKEPVRSIVSFSNLLKRYKDNDERRQEFSGYIVKSGKQFSRLVDNIRDYQEIEQLEVQKEVVQLSRVTEDVILALNKIISTRNVSVNFSYMPKIMSSHYALVLVLKNLIENSIRFNAEENPRINIWSETKNDSLQILIKDNGIGIEKEYHEQIFQLFKRLGTDSSKGSGLGLNIARKIINQLGGDLRLHSSEIGVGSIFAISFPVSVVIEDKTKTTITKTPMHLN